MIFGTDSNRNSPLKHLLILYHSQTGKNQIMADAVFRGTQQQVVDGVETRLLRASVAGVEDLLWADAVIFGTPENFGYMSGAMKDFFDRVFYPCEGKMEATPYAMFIGTGNDGTLAATGLRRIANGLAFKEIQPPVIAVGVLTDEHLEACEMLGTTVAAGLELGVF